jgi:very-short-patch-repair endonuclease
MSCRARWVNSRRPKKSGQPNHLNRAERGGLPRAQFLLWQALGQAWQPQFWVSPLGDLGDDIVYFVIDVALPGQKLAVEVDGRGHRYSVERDRQRDEWLTAEGWKVLRFSNTEILASVESVVEKIRWHWMT